MSIFPAGTIKVGQRTAVADRDSRRETDGVLIRPIDGQIYLIEEDELEALADAETQSRLTGFVSRH